MSKNSGLLVEYTTKDGSTQKAIAYSSDQRDEFKAKNKVLLVLIDKDFKPLSGEFGKPVLALKSSEKLKVIGFVD